MANGSSLVGHGHFDAFQTGPADDWVISDGTDVLAVGRGGFQMADSGMVHLSMGMASYVADHSVVAFIFDAGDQAITGVEVIWPNTQGQVDEMCLQVASGETVSFGLLTDGAGLNDYESLEGGVYDVVKLDCGNFGLTHVADDGTTTPLAGDLLLSTTQNTASGSFTDVPNTIQIGFEDGYGGDDGNFNDLTFTMSVSDATVDQLAKTGSYAGENRAEGGGGSDMILSGEGSDLMVEDMAWNEWQSRDGEWHYHPEEMQPLRADVTGTAVDPSDDILIGGTGNDLLQGNNANDILCGGVGDDMLFGGSEGDQLSGSDGDDRVFGGTGADHLWGGNVIHGNTADIFVYRQGDGNDMIHDFESDLDRIDLSSYGMTFEELKGRVVDLGWATEIDLSDLASNGEVDRIILRSVDANDLMENNFVF